MVLKQQHIWHRSSHWKPQWFCGFPQGMVPWINVVDNPGPPWRKTMRLGWSCLCASRDTPKKHGPFFRTRLMFRGGSLIFFGRWLDCCVWWKFFVQFFFEKQVQEPANAEINAVNQHKKPKEALLFDKLSLKFPWVLSGCVVKIISTEWHFTYMSPILFWVLDLRTWLSLLVTLIVAAIKIQSKNSPRPWDFQSQQLFGDACCRHVSLWVM